VNKRSVWDLIDHTITIDKDIGRRSRRRSRGGTEEKLGRSSAGKRRPISWRKPVSKVDTASRSNQAEWMGKKGGKIVSGKETGYKESGMGTRFNGVVVERKKR
jgi:hypothetical protein